MRRKFGHIYCTSCQFAFESSRAVELHFRGHPKQGKCLEPQEAGLIDKHYPEGTVWGIPGE